MEEAAQVAPGSSQMDSADTTQALLKTFTLVELPDENTCCSDPTEPSHQNGELQLANEGRGKGEPAIKNLPGVTQLCCCCLCFVSPCTSAINTCVQ